MSAIDSYLRQSGMHPDCLDFDTYKATLCAEMDRGTKGPDSSLAMLPTYLNPDGELPFDRPVLVIDAGGTNLRTAFVTLSREKDVLVEELKETSMPGSRGALSKEAYLAAMVEILAPYMDRADRVGYCFSYPAEILPNLDGRLICMTKGIQIRGSVGMEVCRELDAALQAAGYTKTRHYTLLNDTVASALGGLYCAKRDGLSYDGLLGFVLGTGCNVCGTQTSAALTRYPAAAAFAAPRMLVNMEAGACDIFPLGRADELLHQNDLAPGAYCFEKMVSGAYLGRLVTLTARDAAAQGFFSENAAEALASCEEFISADCSAFLQDASKGRLAALCREAKDRETLSRIIEAINRRAAKLSAILLAAALEQGKLGRLKNAPAIILAEGSTFWKASRIREEVEFWLEKNTAASGSSYARVLSVPHANLIGSAAAALLAE